MNCNGCVFEVKNMAKSADVPSIWKVSSYVVGVDGSHLQSATLDTSFGDRGDAHRYLIDNAAMSLSSTTVEEIRAAINSVPPDIDFELVINWDECDSNMMLNQWTLVNVSCGVRFGPQATTLSGAGLLDLAADICTY
jgi:hypothetical protein